MPLELIGHYVDPHEPNSFDRQIIVTQGSVEPAWGQICYLAQLPVLKGDLLQVYFGFVVRNDAGINAQFVHQLVADTLWTPDNIDRLPTGFFLFPQMAGENVNPQEHYAVKNLSVSWQAERDYPMGLCIQMRCKAQSTAAMPETPPCTIVSPPDYAYLICDLIRTS